MAEHSSAGTTRMYRRLDRFPGGSSNTTARQSDRIKYFADRYRILQTKPAGEKDPNRESIKLPIIPVAAETTLRLQPSTDRLVQ